jgi:hypothetical protein
MELAKDERLVGEELGGGGTGDRQRLWGPCEYQHPLFSLATKAAATPRAGFLLR